MTAADKARAFLAGLPPHVAEMHALTVLQVELLADIADGVQAGRAGAAGITTELVLTEPAGATSSGRSAGTDEAVTEPAAVPVKPAKRTRPGRTGGREGTAGGG